MNQEILDIIARNLPSMQVDVLKAELKKAEQHDTSLKTIAELREKNRQLEDNKTEQAKNITALTEKLTNTLKKLDDIAAREFNLQNTLLKAELDYIKQSREDLKYLINAAFANTVVKERINRQHLRFDPNGGQYTSPSIYTSQDETEVTKRNE